LGAIETLFPDDPRERRPFPDYFLPKHYCFS